MVVIGLLVLGDRGNPNGIKSHTLDVVEVISNAFKRTATENVEGGAFSSRTISSCKSIRKNLVDRP